MKDLKQFYMKDERLRELVKESAEAKNLQIKYESQIESLQEKIQSEQAAYRQAKKDYAEATEKADAKAMTKAHEKIEKLEKEMTVKFKTQRELARMIELLGQEIKRIENELKTLLKDIAVYHKIKTELGKAVEILDEFLKLDQELKDGFTEMYQFCGLKVPNLSEYYLSVKGNYDFVEHLRATGERISHHIQVSNRESHKELYSKKLSKRKRIAMGQGKPKPKPEPLQPDSVADELLEPKAEKTELKPDKPETKTDTVKPKGGAAQAVSPEENDSIFG